MKALKRIVFNQCVLPVMTYGAESLTLTKKPIKKIQVMQRAMGRSMLGISLRDRVPNSTIRLRTRIIDVVERIAFLKWNWAGHIDGRGTKRIFEWKPREDAFRSRDRQDGPMTLNVSPATGYIQRKTEQNGEFYGKPTSSNGPEWLIDDQGRSNCIF